MAIIGKDRDGALLVGRFDKGSPTLRSEIEAFQREASALGKSRDIPFVVLVHAAESDIHTVWVYPAFDRPSTSDITVASPEELAAVQQRLQADALSVSGTRSVDKLVEALGKSADTSAAADDFDAL